MLMRLARRKWKLTAALVVAFTAITGVALAYAYTVVYGTSGNDTINDKGKAGNFHIYGFQGSDNLTAGNGNITIVGSKPVINGYDLIYGDGLCTQELPGNDSYCEMPAPWLPQPWTDTAGSNDNITGGAGPSILVGGGGNNTITGSKTYDVIVGGGPSGLAGGTTTAHPNVNNITGSLLGSAIIAIQPTDVSNITLKKTTLVVGLDGLIGLPNAVDVYVPNRSSTLAPNVINCANPSNLDVIFANKNDTVKNCFLVFRGVAPIFPGHFAPANASSTEPFPFPLTALESPSSLLRYGKTHTKASKHSSKKHSSKKG
ncbi:MAG: hypothetical protein ACLP0J_29335 [Solirubrobacteraceae bacterium]